ncbi:HAD family acid phosphatase, partial [Providencia stuartii]|nr:HAD family acid phosphatase [Providencia stuartii]
AATLLTQNLFKHGYALGKLWGDLSGLGIPADKMNPVIFAGDEPGQNNKVSWMRDHKLKIYYGDADADIAAARELNIRGIRILRAANSSYQPLPKAGQFGEEVVINSEY